MVSSVTQAQTTFGAQGVHGTSAPMRTTQGIAGRGASTLAAAAPVNTDAPASKGLFGVVSSVVHSIVQAVRNFFACIFCCKKSEEVIKAPKSPEVIALEAKTSALGDLKKLQDASPTVMTADSYLATLKAVLKDDKAATDMFNKLKGMAHAIAKDANELGSIPLKDWGADAIKADPVNKHIKAAVAKMSTDLQAELDRLNAPVQKPVKA